jgi:FAD/FMN-containing dehydrogenase/SAM-dependent methyltransferase
MGFQVWYWYVAKFGVNQNDHFISSTCGANIGDVGRFHSQTVRNVAYPHSTADIQHLLTSTTGPLCVRGTAHSMGGHTLCPWGGGGGGLQLDMRHMNRLLWISPTRMLATVEAGMQWSELIRVANVYGLAPMTLQSYSSFSIGGSLSVNAHGVTNDWTVAHSVVSFRLVTVDGQLHHCSRTKNSQLFRAAIGGFGLLGIIVDVTLHLSYNEPYELVSSFHNVSQFHQLYQTRILDDPLVGVKMARLNFLLDSPHLPAAIHLYQFRRTKLPPPSPPSPPSSPSPSQPSSQCHHEYWHPFKQRCGKLHGTSQKGFRSALADDASEMNVVSRFAYKWIFDLEAVQTWRYWWERQTGKPIDWSTTSKIERNTLLHESAYSLSVLDRAVDLHKTHILQEFFVPPSNFLLWMERFWEIRQNTSSVASSLLNLTIRFVRQDKLSMLPYAPTDCYAMVLYYRVSISKEGWEELNQIHRQLAAMSVELGGRFYLPYLHHYSPNLLHQAYPNLNTSFATIKHHYDPHSRLSNLWAQSYNLVPSTTLTNAATTTTTTNTTVFDRCEFGAGGDDDGGAGDGGGGVVEVGRVRGRMRELVKMGCLGLHDLELFYRQIFVLVPEDNGAAVAERVRWFLAHGRFLDDTSLYEHLQAYADRRLNKPPFIYRSWRELWALRRQKKEMVHEITRLLRHLGIGPAIENYLSIGDGGRYATVLQDTGLIAGTHLDLHDKTLGFFERHAYESPSNFFVRLFAGSTLGMPRVDFNDAQTVERALREIPDGYIGVAISVVGFHHYMPIMNRLLKQLYRVIAPGGLLIIREHDARPELMPLLHVAHTTFNAFTGVPLQDETTERRQFLPVHCWRQLLATYGFQDTFISEKQPHDPTHNVLLSFRRM